MSRTIFKYEISMNDLTTIAMQAGAEILIVQVQKDAVCMWAIVDPKAEKEHRSFAIYGTGHDMLDVNHTYIGTFQVSSGDYVFHVFELLGKVGV